MKLTAKARKEIPAGEFAGKTYFGTEKPKAGWRLLPFHYLLPPVRSKYGNV